MISNIQEKIFGVAGAAAKGAYLGSLGVTGGRILIEWADFSKLFNTFIPPNPGCSYSENHKSIIKLIMFGRNFIWVPAVCAAFHRITNEIGHTIKSRLPSNDQKKEFSLITRSCFGLLHKATSLAQIALPILLTKQLFNNLGHTMDLLEVFNKSYVIPGITAAVLAGIVTLIPPRGMEVKFEPVKAPEAAQA